jgi:pimeloyl-ACP methyl ester carboxylesterase
MKFFGLLVLLALAVAEDPDATATFQQLCTENGFQAEQHTVTTADGYILTMFRIPGLLNEAPGSPKQPLLMHHGLLDCSDTWVVNDADLAPAFIMATAGYDVWLGNSRGNKYAMAHTTLTPSDKAFWQFSWMQFSEYDIPADIDYILATTGFPKLTYMGHSQGTLIMFALLSEQPEWADKLTTFVAVGPVGTVRNLTAQIIIETAKSSVLEDLNNLGVYDFLPNPDTPSLFYYFCDIMAWICDGVTQWLADMEVQGVDNTARFPVILAHEPGGTSVMNMMHWQQMVQYPAYYMQKFDYGTAENMQVYGQATPPRYDLSQIRAPIAAYFGVYDELADPIDGAWLISQLKANTQIPGLHIVDNLAFGHLTFMWGLNMDYLQDVQQWMAQWTVGNQPSSAIMQ